MAAWEIASKLTSLNEPFYFSHKFVHQKFKKGSVEQFLLGVTHAVVVRCQLGLQTSDDLTGLDVQDGSFTQRGVDTGVHCEHIWVINQFVHMASSAWLSQDTWSFYMVLVSSRANVPKEPGKSCMASSEPALNVTASHLLCSTGYKEVTKSPQIWGEETWYYLSIEEWQEFAGMF